MRYLLLSVLAVSLVGILIIPDAFADPIELDKVLYNWTDIVYITITIPEHNLDSAAVETIGTADLPIQVITRVGKMCPTGDKTYKAVETGPDTGIFTAQVELTGFDHTLSSMTTAYSAVATSCGTGNTDGKIKTLQQTDGISVSYEYIDGVVIVASASVNWNIGEASFDSTTISIGDPATFTVVDPDENVDSAIIDAFTVGVYSNSDQGGLPLAMTETGVDTGIFTGVFITTTDITGSKLHVSDGDTVTAEYNDVTLPEPYLQISSLTMQETLIVGTIPFERAPAANVRLVDAFGSPVAEMVVDQQVQIQADVSNVQGFDQAFAYLVQMRDSYNVPVSLAWITGSLSSGQSMDPALSWTPSMQMFDGTYTATVFVWESVDNPIPLSPPASTTVYLIGGGVSAYAITQPSSGCGEGTVLTEGVCHIPSPDSVGVDSHVYDYGNEITISGNFENYDGISHITIIVYAPNGNLMTVNQIVPDSSGSFSTDEIAAGMFSLSGTYTVKAYLGDNVLQTTFLFGGASAAEPEVEAEAVEEVDEEPEVEEVDEESTAFFDTPVNDPPLALGLDSLWISYSVRSDDYNISLDEDTTIQVLLSGFDPDGDSLSFEIVTQPTHGTLTEATSYPSDQHDHCGVDEFSMSGYTTCPHPSEHATKSYLYTPDNDYAWTDSAQRTVDSFTYRVNDGTFDSVTFSYPNYPGGSHPGTPTIEIRITPVNDIPVANAGTDQSVNPGDIVQLDGSQSYDVDDPISTGYSNLGIGSNDELTYSWIQTAGSPVTLTSSIIPSPQFTAPSQGGLLTFMLTLSDGVATSSPNVVNIYVGQLIPESTPPPAPGSVASNTSDSQVTLTWSPPSDDGGSAITDYLVEYATADSGTWLAYDDGTSTTTSATITGLSNGQEYNFRISAVNSEGIGDASGSVDATPSVEPEVDTEPVIDLESDAEAEPVFEPELKSEPVESSAGCGAGTVMVNGVCQVAKTSGTSMAIEPMYIVIAAVAIGGGAVGALFALKRGSGTPKPAREELEEYESKYVARKPAEKKETSSSCSNCGNTLNPKAKFCGKCGNQV